jgi:hypothetical protein
MNELNLQNLVFLKFVRYVFFEDRQIFVTLIIPTQMKRRAIHISASNHTMDKYQFWKPMQFSTDEQILTSFQCIENFYHAYGEIGLKIDWQKLYGYE